ncbi:MAG: Ldh family oxidoreductase [Phycisphaeraceae bacterium]|nr:Ldh family oxidoreductase [Phycisphaeraceae bacterium]
MSERILSVEKHNQIVAAAYRQRGFTADESQQAARFCQLAAWHGIKTHNALKALHLDDHFGSVPRKKGCVPGAVVEKLPSKFAAAQKWNANRKLGPAVAFDAMAACEKLADQYGVGIVSVDNAFHYLWGGGYVLESAKRGYIAYTCCTAALAEVVPFGGKFPTLGTNPHSWAFPTTDAVGFPIVIDWATSTVAMGRVQQLKREGKSLPPGSAVDKDGKETTDPHQVAALITFGAHKGYGLSLINELLAAFIGGSLPTLRSRPDAAVEAGSPAVSEKTTPNFFFQVIHPEALDCGDFALQRNQAANVKAVLDDVLGHGNRDTGRCILPGELEHKAALRSQQAGGLIFTDAELAELKQVADSAGVSLDPAALPTI